MKQARSIKTGSSSSQFMSLEGDTVNNLLSREQAVKRIEQVSAAFDEQGTMRTEPVKISLKDNVMPYAVYTARRVPIPLLPKVKAELQRMEENGVIGKITYPTDWCAPIVPSNET